MTYTTTATKNQFPGTCYKCGTRVETGAGLCSGGPGRWIIEHTTCGIAADGTLAPGWSNVSRARRGYGTTARCRYCGGTVRGGGCTDCGEYHEEY